MNFVSQDLYSLEQVCGGLSVFPTAEKTISVLINLILPLCFRMGCGNSRKGKLASPTVLLKVCMLPFNVYENNLTQSRS
jgi:hypothetical protein